MTNNYTVYHLHSDLSNGVTNIDSVTKYHEYIEKAKECGMTALGFSEHGNVFEWWHKKKSIEGAGMKYIHASEFYVTETLDEKIRDNYHIILIAKNGDGMRELNRLATTSFNRDDNHFYYVPRISIDELISTSSNIIMTTACLGGILHKGNEDIKDKFLEFCTANKDRCFLEIQHHCVQDQIDYNKYLLGISKRYDIPLIAGTDTHALNETHLSGRKVLQQGKGVHFKDEEEWDLAFKTYDQLCKCYELQNSVPKKDYLQAIENTNLIADMVEEFQVDTGFKYPKIYDNPEDTFKQKIRNALSNHKYAKERHGKQIEEVLNTEYEVYKKTQSIDFLLLQNYIREWEAKNGIRCGYSRGSVSGSMIAYILGITEMDSLKFDLNFFRFQNPDRVTVCDIDTDYGGQDRDKVKEFILKDRMNLEKLHTSEIITFNTIALRGAIRDIGRALEIPLEIVDEISKSSDDDNAITRYRKKYPELFKYADIVNGTIVSVGSHPAGVLISELDLSEEIGLCTTKGSQYPVSMLNMNELDDLKFVKLDILGLDNIEVINQTCDMVGIDRLNPDNVDLEDKNVWESIRDNTTMIFQWESDFAQTYIRKFMSKETIDKVKNRIPNFSMLKWLSFGNGLLRPACASYRNEVAEGRFNDTGLEELNIHLSKTMGYVTMQEDIMQFLVEFCGYSQAESDTVRRNIAKKSETESLLPEIEKRFISHTSKRYNVEKDKCKEIIKPFLNVVLDAVDYAFSWNHSDSYSCIGYICGYLRYYYPLEFLTCALNTFADNEDKSRAILAYAENVGIKIVSAKFGQSQADYIPNKKENVIYRGLSSVKFLNRRVSEELYELRNNTYSSFSELLVDIKNKTTANSRQIKILIMIDYFREFGNSKELSRIYDIVETLKFGCAARIGKDKITNEETVYTRKKLLITDIFPFEKHCRGRNKDGSVSESYTIENMNGLLSDLEDYILSLGLEDVDLRLKIASQQEYMGYVDLTTGQESDRRKLLITDIFPLKDKRTRKPWAWVALTQSLGTGKKSRLTIMSRVYDRQPIKKHDIIYASNVYKDKNDYWHIGDYEIVV